MCVCVEFLCRRVVVVNMCRTLFFLVRFDVIALFLHVSCAPVLLSSLYEFFLFLCFSDCHT